MALPEQPGSGPPIGGGYRLIRQIGRGAFGEVWHAEAPSGGAVAIKISCRPINDPITQRELDALGLVKNLRHPFLLQTHSYHQQKDQLFIVMELADGSLVDRLKECQAATQAGIPPQELGRYILEAAEALDCLHENGIQHRDIKPQSILFFRRHAKVGGLGLASIPRGAATNSGTPLYLAPEIWRGKISEHSDQYALAMTYAEMRLARRVFTGTQMMEVMIDHLGRQPAFPELPVAEALVLTRALFKDPAQRFSSCLAFAEALAAALGM
jgi:serine/threonine protein kinase